MLRGGLDNKSICPANRKKSTYRARSTLYRYITLKHARTHRHTHMHTHADTLILTLVKLGQQSPAEAHAGLEQTRPRTVLSQTPGLPIPFLGSHVRSPPLIT